MFENMKTPPESIDDAIKAEKSKHEVMTILLDMMIEAEDDQTRKTQMLITKQIGKIGSKLHEHFRRLSDIRDQSVTETEAKEALEYLVLVEAGIDSFIESKKGTANG